MQAAGIDRRAHWNSLIGFFYDPHPELKVRQFSSILDFQMFAAIVGYNEGKRKQISGEKMSIPWRVVANNQTCIELINLVALASAKNDAKILKADNDLERVSIFEEYSENGFQIIESWTKDNATDIFKDKIIEQKIIELKNSVTLSDEISDTEDAPPIIDFQ